MKRLALLLLVGCAGSLPKVTPAQRVQLEIIALRSACAEYVKQPTRFPELDEVCGRLMVDEASAPTEPDDAPHSGDGGPPTESVPAIGGSSAR